MFSSVPVLFDNLAYAFWLLAFINCVADVCCQADQRRGAIFAGRHWVWNWHHIPRVVKIGFGLKFLRDINRQAKAVLDRGMQCGLLEMETVSMLTKLNETGDTDLVYEGN